MCGIAGIISLNESRISISEILKMTTEINHRGPDGEGLLLSKFHENNFANVSLSNCVMDSFVRDFTFSHKRLSIIDLSEQASMPMTDVDNRFWITYNGEIYNHSEIRAELERLGARFKTDHSDTEVILNAFKYWGINCLKKFVGMFAFAIYDKLEDNFYFVRDRMGVKPFYYTIFEKRFYFSSSLRSLLRIEGFSPSINYKSLSDYFTYSSVPAPNTIISNIYKLEPSTYIQIKEGTVSDKVKYWDAFNDEVPEIENENEAIDKVMYLLERSVKYRLISDVPVGCMLSGGLDSSTNLALMQKNYGLDIKAYSVGFENTAKYNNELPYARKVAKFLDVKLTELVISKKEYLDTHQHLIKLFDEPIYDTANVPIYLMSRAAKNDGIKVLFGGEGSDELFLGYSLWTKLNNFYNRAKGVNPTLLYNMLMLANMIPYFNKRTTYYTQWAKLMKDKKHVFNGGYNIFDEDAKHSIFSDSVNEFNAAHSSYYITDKLFASFKTRGGSGLTEFMSYMDINFRLPDILLARLDMATMASGVEARDNFVDHTLVEYCLKMKPSLKVKNGIEKYILKQAVKDLLPHDIVNRPKQSFIVPIEDILLSKNESHVNINELIAFNKEYNLFNNDFLKNDLIKHNSKNLFVFLLLKDWILENKIVA